MVLGQEPGYKHRVSQIVDKTVPTHLAIAGRSRRAVGAMKRRWLRYRERRQYVRWFRKYVQRSASDRSRLERAAARVTVPPLISIVMPVYQVPEAWLRSAIGSVRQQIYPNWELCLVDDHSNSESLTRLLQTYARVDPRIRVHFREKRGHICEATNTGFEMATGDYVALMDHDDELSEDALLWVAEQIDGNSGVELIYSDEDKIDEKDRHFDPHFKPDWSPDLFLTSNYINHLTVLKRSRVEQVGGMRTGYEGSQDYDLLLRVTEGLNPSQIVHVPRVLYHWRSIAGSVAKSAGEKNYAREAALRAVQSHFERNRIRASVTTGFQVHHRVRYPLATPVPKVSLMVPTRDRIDLLQTIVDGILNQTQYDNFELIIIDNDSVESTLR